MRMGKIKVLGQEYKACLSTRIILHIEEKTGKGFEAGINELLGKGDMAGLFWLMAEMLKAGKTYADLTGEPAPEPPCYDDLIDLVGVDEYQGLVQTIIDTATDTGTPDVVVEGDSKNPETTTPGV